ncbi:hypothetical protein VTO42DRAFT_453 [Malbranchea cinnamomea]
MEYPPIAGKKVIVLGAGIAGLAFVVSLRKIWPDAHPFPDVVVYERDDKQASIGREGYSISIRGDVFSGGLQALEDMGLLDAASAAAITRSGSGNPGGFGLWDLKWNRILNFGREPGMRIARNALRQILVDAALDAKGVSIRWRTAFRDVKIADGKAIVTLADGTTDEADLVIAADGANSKTRATLRPDDKLSFARATCISATSRFPDGQIPAPMNRDWGFVVGGNGTGLFFSPISSNSALWSLSYLAKEPRETPKRPYSTEQADALLKEALDRGRSFTEPFQTLVKNSDPSTLMIINAMDKLAFYHTDPQTSVIFIGDSNHAVSPFSGNGANMALLDGWELAVQLSKPQPLANALAEYDKASVPRCRSAVNFSHWSIDLAHATGLRLLLYKTGLKFASLLTQLRS